MHWSLRHQGSPRAVENLSFDQVLVGLRDGAWDATDEIRGADESAWQPIEAHPQFAEAAADLEEANLTPLVHRDADEERIDMNPLIDVCLVLLVFFILATTMQVLERVLDLPKNQQAGSGVIPNMDWVDVQRRMIIVQVRPGAGGAVFVVGDTEVNAANLEAAVKRAVRQTHHQELVIDAKSVDWGSVVQVIDAAAGARIRKVHFKVDADPAAGTPPTVDM